jgi:RNA polymerase-binding transcription factor DksA
MANLDRSEIRHVLAERRQALLARWRRDIERECERRGLGASGWRGLARPHRDRGQSARLASSKARELGEIIAAMRRLEHGRYGVCVFCGSGIEERRLHTIPETRMCGHCAEPAEEPQCARL